MNFRKSEFVTKIISQNGNKVLAKLSVVSTFIRNQYPTWHIWGTWLSRK